MYLIPFCFLFLNINYSLLLIYGDRKMIVIIGSRNKAKIRGVMKAFKLIGINKYESIDVTSLNKQPYGLDDIFINASRRTVEACKYLGDREGFCVGVEAGILELSGLILSGQLSIVTDRKKYSIGLSGFFPVPGGFKKDLREGVELGVLMERISKVKDIARNIGAIGFFTYGFISRVELTFHSTLYALIPWINGSIEYDLPSYIDLIEILKREKYNI